MNYWVYTGVPKSKRAEALYKYQIRNLGEVERLLRSVSLAFGIDEDKILGKSRLQRITDARHCFVFLVRMHTGMTVKKIGAYLGRNHATILHSIRVFQQIEQVDKACREKRQIAENIFHSNLNIDERALQEIEY